MGTYAAIADTSETLIELLRERITERSDVVAVSRSEIAVVSPDDVGADSDVRLGLFLYDVSENSILKNDRPVPADDDRRRETSLALDLHYLLTAYPAQGGDETGASLDQQRVLGLAMQVFHDNSILGPDELPASMSERDVHITFEDEPPQLLSDVWSGFRETALQPSVTYQVSPVLIDATTEYGIERVTETTMDYQTPGGE